MKSGLELVYQVDSDGLDTTRWKYNVLYLISHDCNIFLEYSLDLIEIGGSLLVG